MVIWVLMMLSVIVTQFCYTMRTQVNITYNLRESVQAYYIAQAGLNKAVAEIIRQTMSPGRILEVRGHDAEEENQVFWRLNMDLEPVSFAGGSYQVHISNESGKIDINRAGSRLLLAMLEGFDIQEEQKDIIVDSILDWRDTNDLRRANGAENDYYLSLDPPYECKDADFDTVEELLLVRGITPEVFYGGLEKMVTVLPAGRWGIYSEAVRDQSYNFNRININGVPERLLANLPGMTSELAEQIVEFRRQKDFRRRAEIVDVVGREVYSQISSYITFDTHAYYTISAIGVVNGSKNREGIEVLIALDRRAEKKYRVIRWRDRISQDSRAWLINQGGGPQPETY